MIHVAPCSCELHQALREALERNRELEAKMAMFVNTPNNWLLEKDRMFVRIHEQSGRIRELEAELETLRGSVSSEVDTHPGDWLCKPVIASWKARAEKAERTVQELNRSLDERQARVAELERHLPHIKWELGISAASGCPNCAEPLAAIERGERVGDETPSQGVQEREEC